MPEKTDDNNKNKGLCCCCPSKKKKIQLEPSTCPVTNVPYVAQLPKDLSIGKAICVTGVIQPNCARFSVNLTCGKEQSADIAFHLNPRLFQRYIVRNSRLNGQWGAEETTSIEKFNLERTKNFEICIFVAENEFLVAFNGRHVCAFKFRVPLAKLTNIEVEGEVDVLGVEFKELKSYPEIVFGTEIVEGGDGSEEEPKIAMDIPSTILLPKGFQLGWQIEIYGRVKILPHSFFINLQEGSHRWPHPVIPLHLNLRFCSTTTSGDLLCVRNAWTNGDWGKEERTSNTHFLPATPFTIYIRRESDHFSIWANGKLVAEFKFRYDANKIDTVYIQGDVVVFRALLNKDPKRF